MQGKYNAEVPRLHQDLRAMNTQLQDVQTRVSEQPRSAPAQTPPAALVTADDETKFGADLIDLVRRVVREAAQPFGQHLQQLDAMVRSLAPRAERAEAAVQKTQQQLFNDTLNQGVPNWQAINADPAWHQWLGEVDPLNGEPRQVSLDKAAEALNAPRVVAIFKLFEATLAPVATTQQAQRSQKQAELARQVAPSKSSSTTTPPPAKPAFTGSDYTYWTAPQRAHHTPAAELQATLNTLEEAFHEGRIDWSK
jgi:hypothetical protein